VTAKWEVFWIGCEEGVGAEKAVRLPPVAQKNTAGLNRPCRYEKRWQNHQLVCSQATGTPRKRRENRIARWWAYHCCLARSAECLRLRLPSGMAFSLFSSWRVIRLSTFPNEFESDLLPGFWKKLENFAGTGRRKRGLSKQSRESEFPRPPGIVDFVVCRELAAS
jgi:hypothetical protein